MNPVERFCAQLLEKQERRNRFYHNNQVPPRDGGRANNAPPANK